MALFESMKASVLADAHPAPAPGREAAAAVAGRKLRVALVGAGYVASSTATSWRRCRRSSWWRSATRTRARPRRRPAMERAQRRDLDGRAGGPRRGRGPRPRTAGPARARAARPARGGDRRSGRETAGAVERGGARAAAPGRPPGPAAGGEPQQRLPPRVRPPAGARAGRPGGRVEHVQVCLSVRSPQLEAGDFSHWMFRSPKNIVFEQAPHPLSQLHALIGPVREARTTILGTRKLLPGQLFHDRWLVAARGERGTGRDLPGVRPGLQPLDPAGAGVGRLGRGGPRPQPLLPRGEDPLAGVLEQLPRRLAALALAGPRRRGGGLPLLPLHPRLRSPRGQLLRRHARLGAGVSAALAAGQPPPVRRPGGRGARMVRGDRPGGENPGPARGPARGAAPAGAGSGKAGRGRGAGRHGLHRPAGRGGPPRAGIFPSRPWCAAPTACLPCSPARPKRAGCACFPAAWRTRGPWPRPSQGARTVVHLATGGGDTWRRSSAR